MTYPDPNPGPADPGPTERQLTDSAEHDANAGDAPAPDEDDGTPDAGLPPALKIPLHNGPDGTGCPWTGVDSMSGICPDGCPDGIHRDARYAVVVTRTDGEVRRFGPVHRGHARGWQAELHMQLPGSAPEGTTVEVEPYRPLPPTGHDYIDPATIPDTVEDLIEPLRADPGHPANGGFPDLYARVVMKHGDNRGGDMWMEACRRIDADAEYAEAEANIGARAALAAALLAEAIAAATSASATLSKLLAEAADWDLPALQDRYPSDASAHLDDGLRSLRAAERVFRPVKEDSPS